MGQVVSMVAIVQARMSSSRLPGKVLLDLCGKPVLGHIVERLGFCRTINKVVVATSDHETDDPIEQFCFENSIRVFRGSLEDVLFRFVEAARSNAADNVLRITGDCPLIDPIVVDCVVAGFLSGKYDLYGLGGEFPDGLDCTVYSFDALQKAHHEATLVSDREHVGTYIERNPKLFRVGALEVFEGLGNYRWTLDEPEDYAFLKQIFEHLHPAGSLFLSHDVLRLLEAKPHLMNINAGIVRNAGYLKSLELDVKSGDEVI